MTAKHKTTCACGRLELELAGAPVLQCYCHCTDCRSWLNAPVHGAAVWPKAAVTIVKGADDLLVYKRTEKSWRTSCKACGGAVFVDHPKIGVIDVLATNIRNFKFAPAFHIYYGERLIDLKDGLPKYVKTPKSMGGDDAMTAQ